MGGWLHGVREECVGKGVRCCALVLRAVVLESRGVRITASRGSVALGFVGRLPHVRARDLPAEYLQQVGWVLDSEEWAPGPGKGAVEGERADRQCSAHIISSVLASSPLCSNVAKQLKARISFHGTGDSFNGSASPTGAYTGSKQF